MGKKSRRRQGREKKSKETKTQQERLDQVDDIKGKMQGQLGLSPATDDATRQFYEIMDHFVETGEGSSGKIKEVIVVSGGVNRRIAYILTNTKEKDCTVRLVALARERK